MKNVTIVLDDETHRAARIYAAGHGTSLSALVKEHLIALVAPATVDQRTSKADQAFVSSPGIVDEADDGSPAKPVWTSDGKPRQPGALRGVSDLLVDDLDPCPVETLAEFGDWDEDAFDALP